MFSRRSGSRWTISILVFLCCALLASAQEASSSVPGISTPPANASEVSPEPRSSPAEAPEKNESPADSIPVLERESAEHDHDQPLRVQGVYIVDALSNVSGGIKRDSKVLGNLNLVVDRTTHWGGNFHAYILANHGGGFSSTIVGDYQYVSHIEAPPNVTLFEGYYQQKLLDDRLSLLVGLYALDSEFDVRTGSDLFVHSSPGTGADLGQIGRNGPGIFPVGALGGRLRYEDAGWYGQAAILEGVPGDPARPTATAFRFDSGEGLFVIGEVGHEWRDDDGPLGKVALGAWGFTAPYETFLDPGIANASNRGGYLSLEKTLYREAEDHDQGLQAYLRVGMADGRINPIQTFAGMGLIYTGPFSGRDYDRLGFAVNSGFTGDEYRASGDYKGHETALELTYSFVLNKNFAIQPDLQYVIYPGFSPDLKNALVLGLRAIVSVGN